MTDRRNDSSDMDAQSDFLPQMEESTDGDAPDFDPEEFEADILASARMMRDTIDDEEQYNEAEFFDLAPDEFETAEDARNATSLPLGQIPAKYGNFAPQIDNALRSIMSDVFGDRRAASASKALMIDYRRALQAGGGTRDHATALRWAVLRLARKSRQLEKPDADALFGCLSRLLHGSARGDATKVKKTHGAVSRSELRAACSALRDAARHLLRVERRLTARAEEIEG